MKKILCLTLLISLLTLSLFAGGSKENSNAITVISREEGSGTRSAFIELVGVEEKVDGVKTDLTTEEAEIANSTSVVITTVQGNVNAIGYISMGSLSSSVKALTIDGVYPTVESVKSGDYKLSRPFNVAYKTLSPAASDFLDYVMSKDGQDVIEKKGYIRVNESGESYSPKGLEGTLTISGSSSVYPVMEVLVENYSSLNPSVKVTLMQSDSTTGVNDAISGTSDIGMASRELKSSELEKGLTELTIAMDGIVVIVNNNNSVSAMTSETVKNIYKGLVTSWDNL